MAADDEGARAARFTESLRGRSLTWLAGEIGAAVSTVSGYARGKAPPGLVAVRIAEVLGIDLVWYLTGREPTPSLPAGAVRVPRLSADGSGLGALAFDEESVRSAASAGEVFALSVAGSAMAPTVPAGADALCAKEGCVPEDGRLHVVRMGGAMAVRRIQALASGGFLLVCDNPAFPAEAVDAEGGVDVVGRVFAVIHRP